MSSWRPSHFIVRFNLRKVIGKRVRCPSSCSIQLCTTVCAPGQNGDKTLLEIKKLCSQWEGSACTSVEFMFCSFPFVPNVFTSSFHEVFKVLKLFPKTFPIAPQFYPTPFAESSTLMYIKWNGGPWGSTFDSIWVVQRGTLLLGSALYSKKIGDGPINMIHNPKKKNLKEKSMSSPMN